MSNLPERYSHTRRRHNNPQHHIDFSGEGLSTNFSLVGVANRQLNNNTNNNNSNSNLGDLNTPQRVYYEEEEKKTYSSNSFKRVGEGNHLENSSSFTNFPALIGAAASNTSQFWNTAHNSFQNFAQNYTQSFEFVREQESPTTSVNFYQDLNDNIENFPIEMPFRDRTSEFKAITKSCQLKYQPNGLSNKEERNKIVQNSVQFNQLAKRIGRDLSLTCAKMEKLTQLAKKKSLFDDRSGEMDELSHYIKKDITGLNKQIANLQELNNLRNNAEDSKKHSKLVVVGLQSKLANVSQNFQNVLEVCTENLKSKKNRREKFSKPALVPSTLPPSATNGNMRGGSLLLHEDAVASGSSSVALDMDSLEMERMQDQLSLIDGSDTYHKDRYSAVETIESSITELGTIFRQLASLVAEQGEVITRIDTNVEESSMNIDAAQHELLRYFNNISQNRWLIIKVFGVLAVFFIFFVIFLT